MGSGGAAFGGSGGGGSSTLTLIQRQVLVATPVTVTFTAIPNTFENLILQIEATNTGVGASSINLQFNGDTTVNYIGPPFNAVSSIATISIPQGALNGNIQGMGSIRINGYARTTMTKIAKTIGSMVTGASVVDVVATGLWKSTAAINRIDLSEGGATGFSVGSVFSLYGES